MSAPLLHSVQDRATHGGLLSALRAQILQPLDDLWAAFDAQIVHRAHRGGAIILMVVAAVATWWVYVPVHELLHAFGCYVTGGGVSELQIAPEYGGALVARFLPFVVSGGDYAGRLSGFDTHGSDLTYLATDAAPFALTIFLGVPLLKGCARGRRLALLGTAFVLALAPFYCVTGDYYEMGSVITTRMLALVRGGGPPVMASLRSDDVFRLLGDLWTRPESLQLHGPGEVASGAALIATSLLVGTVLAFATYAAGATVSRGTAGRRRRRRAG